MSVDVRVDDSGIATVTLDRPPVNALSEDMYRSLLSALGDVESRPGVRAAILASGGPPFCAGADLSEFAVREPRAAGFADERRQALARRTYDTLLNLAVPTVAALTGVALGAGAVLAACCDIRVCGSSFALGLPEVSVVRCGGGRHLMRILPQGVVREMYFTGQRIGSARLLALGAVNDVVADSEVGERAAKIARAAAAKSGVALRAAKSALNAAEPMSIPDGYAIEQAYTLRLLGTDDADEAVRAVLERRKPVWSDRQMP